MLKIVQTFLLKYLTPLVEMIPPKWRIAVSLAMFTLLATAYGCLKGMELTPEQTAIANDVIQTITGTIVALFGVQVFVPKKPPTEPTEPPKE